MKKLLVLMAVLAMVFAGCEQPTDKKNQGQNLPTLTISNQSSYILTNVIFNDISFATSGADLPVTASSTKKLTANDLNKTGYITFTRGDIGIACRTQEAITIADEDETFTFNDNTIVDELPITKNNRSQLSEIDFLSTLTVERGGMNVAKNGVEAEPLGESIINVPKIVSEFSIKNGGTGKLRFDETLPVKIVNDFDGVFSIQQQPTSKEIEPNNSLPFIIRFVPKEEKTYYATVKISSNDKKGDFIFDITAKGVPPKPIISLLYENNEIQIDDGRVGTINADTAGEDLLITKSKNITVVIKNEGDLLLTINSININGADAAAFTTTYTGGNIAAGGQTQFTINCAPVKEGVNEATLTINSNDDSHNPAVIILNVTGKKGQAIVQLGQSSIVIDTSSPINLGRVEMGDFISYTLTIRNIGNIDLELIGDTPVTSSSAAFVVSSQPAKKIIVPGDNTTFQLRFAPNAEAEINGKITILNNTDEGEFVFNVMGIGYVKRPQITIQQGSSPISPYGEYDFGTVPTDEPKSVTFTIRNSGEANLTFENINNNRINLENNTGNLFTITEQPSVATAVIPYGTTTFTVRLSPVTDGTNFTAIVKIKTNSQFNDEFSFTVKGNGYQKKPQIVVRQGVTGNREVTVAMWDSYGDGWNNSAALRINVNGTDLSATARLGTGSGPAYHTFNVTSNDIVSFYWVSGGQYDYECAFAVYYSDAPPNPAFNPNGWSSANDPQGRVLLYKQYSTSGSVGSGTQMGSFTVPGSTTINHNGEFDIGSVAAGKSGEFTFTILNSGEADLNITAVGGNRIDLSDNATGYFSVAMQPSGTVSAGSTTTFTLRFSPNAIGNNFTAMVHINSNSRDNAEFIFRVKGNGRGYTVGETGPGGGWVFYAVGNQFKECSVDLGVQNWNNAVTIAQSYTGGGFNNWRLPDFDEIYDICENIHDKGLGNYYDDLYWSSVVPPTNDNYAWVGDFDADRNADDYKLKTSYAGIIAVRSFSF